MSATPLLLAITLTCLVLPCTTAMQLLTGQNSATITVKTPLSNCTADAACGCATEGDTAYLLQQGTAGRVAIVVESSNVSVTKSSCAPNAQFKIEQMGNYVYFQGRTYPNDPQPGVVGTATLIVRDNQAQCVLKVTLTVDGQSNTITEQPFVLDNNTIELTTPPSCTANCLCNVKGATNINGQYRMQALVSSTEKTLQFRTSNTGGVVYSTQYLKTGSVFTPNQQLPWLQASTPTSSTRPIVIQANANDPIPGARLRVDASVVNNEGIQCTVPIFIDFVSTLPMLPVNLTSGVQLLSNP